MKTLDALREVSREMRLMAHFLHLVSRGEAAGSEEARKFSQQILDMHRQIQKRVNALIAKEPSTNVAPFTVTVARLCFTNPARDSSCETGVIAGPHDQTHTTDLQDQELAGV